MTLGSLFDGSGGFPLAGALCGITPVWSSEIEPYPLKVTALRFPEVRQLGDVTKINGAEIEPVDIITFGSPCQGLSIVGKQKGLEDERSNLFYEAIRIIKEMREATNGEYPAFAVWENVFGAFSSNKGEDFRAVLEAFIGVVESVCPEVPAVSKNGRLQWQYADCYVGDGRSVAYRLFDAQHWGVPQRRRRIYLVADFRGGRAGEILFERKGVSGSVETGGEAREGATAHTERGAGRGREAWVAGFNGWKSVTGSIQYMPDGAPTIEANMPPDVVIASFMGGQGAKAGGIAYCDDGTSPTLKSAESGSNQAPDVVYVGNCLNPWDVQSGRIYAPDGAAPTLQAREKSGLDRTSVVYDMRAIGEYGNGETASTIKQRDFKDATDLVVEQKPPRKYIVRRLTPLECCRLQGFPDWWEDGAGGKDAPRYKMWGNGIALPCAAFVMRGIARETEERQHEHKTDIIQHRDGTRPP